MIKVVIDTDPGYDDAVALAMVLAHPEIIQVLGCVSTAGNQSIDKVTTNLCRLLSFFGRDDITVCCGAQGPLVGSLITAGSVHGESGLDGVDLPSSRIVPENSTSTEFIGSIIRKLNPSFQEDGSKLTILGLGPLTNIACLIHDDPEVIQFIDRIVLMGGSFCGGNVTSTAEFNIYADPEAAELVFSAGVPITLASLDSTNTAVIFPSEVEDLRQGGRASVCIARIFDQYGAFARKRGMPGVRLHDLCAAAILIDPSLFSFEHLPVQIETHGHLTRGMTIADRRPFTRILPNTKVVSSVDRFGLVHLLRQALLRLDALIG